MNVKNNSLFFATFILLIAIAFIQCYKTTSDLYWAFDPDFDRDIAFVQGTLDGNFGKDPNYIGEYLWYNPLLFSIETVIVKITHLPVNIIVARAGAYLNLLCPIFFFIMMSVLFEIKVALAALLSYLFLASGNILSWGAATYSPWLYPGSSMQFLFYLNIIFCYKAFSTQKYFWFAVLGACIGISFLGHTAPALLTILIMISIQLGNFKRALKEKDFKLLKKYFLQSIIVIVPFIIASSPLLYFIVGKYHLHLVNRVAFEYTDELFVWYNFPKLLIENISIALLISIIGFVWFYKNIHNDFIRKIIFNWFFLSIALYIYSTLIIIIHKLVGISLPGTVPAFHFFFYLKALQSVFFGLGFVLIVDKVIIILSEIIYSSRKIKISALSNGLFIFLILLITMIYWPVYTHRADFKFLREHAILRANDKEKAEIYHFIVNNITSDKVILCEPEASIFPVMATGRKMVSINSTFSNPYLDFGKRETDRMNMLSFFKTGQPNDAKKLFEKYSVNFILLSNPNYQQNSPINNKIIFKNNAYTILTINT